MEDSGEVLASPLDALTLRSILGFENSKVKLSESVLSEDLQREIRWDLQIEVTLDRCGFAGGGVELTRSLRQFGQEGKAAVIFKGNLCLNPTELGHFVRNLLHRSAAATLGFIEGAYNQITGNCIQPFVAGLKYGGPGTLILGSSTEDKYVEQIASACAEHTSRVNCLILCLDSASDDDPGTIRQKRRSRLQEVVNKGRHAALGCKRSFTIIDLGEHVHPIAPPAPVRPPRTRKAPRIELPPEERKILDKMQGAYSCCNRVRNTDSHVFSFPALLPLTRIMILRHTFVYRSITPAIVRATIRWRAAAKGLAR